MIHIERVKHAYEINEDMGPMFDYIDSLLAARISLDSALSMLRSDIPSITIADWDALVEEYS